MTQTLLRLAFSFFILTLAGCASWGSGIRLDPVDRPLNEIQAVVGKSLPLGQRRVEAAGREWFSQYFITKGRSFVAAHTAPVRYYAHVYILGDRRPYSIEVYVKRQRREAPSSDSYSDDGTDQELAKLIHKRIQFYLSKRREDLNIIDDFRVF